MRAGTVACLGPQDVLVHFGILLIGCVVDSGEHGLDWEEGSGWGGVIRCAQKDGADDTHCLAVEQSVTLLLCTPTYTQTGQKTC